MLQKSLKSRVKELEYLLTKSYVSWENSDTTFYSNSWHSKIYLQESFYERHDIFKIKLPKSHKYQNTKTTEAYF